MNQKQINAIKILEDAIEDIKANNILSARYNISSAEQQLCMFVICNNQPE